MKGLVLVRVTCHFCRAPYEREIEPEYARVVMKFGICDDCYQGQEQARGMEVEHGGV